LNDENTPIKETSTVRSVEFS